MNYVANVQRWPVLLLAIASVGTTTLIAMNVLSRHGHATGDHSLRGGVVETDIAIDPPVLATLPSFQMVDQSGGAFGTHQLSGKTWIVDFIFSRCAGPCPMMTSRMAHVQQRLRDHPRREDIRLVSISVDGDYDSPAVLERYAQAAGADTDRWLFLTGPAAETWKLITEGFRLPVGQDIKNAATPILHSQKFVLVDAWGRVRGFYDALEPTGQSQLLEDLSRVLDESPDRSGSWRALEDTEKLSGGDGSR